MLLLCLLLLFVECRNQLPISNKIISNKPLRYTKFVRKIRIPRHTHTHSQGNRYRILFNQWRKFFFLFINRKPKEEEVKPICLIVIPRPEKLGKFFHILLLSGICPALSYGNSLIFQSVLLLMILVQFTLKYELLPYDNAGHEQIRVNTDISSLWM